MSWASPCGVSITQIKAMVAKSEASGKAVVSPLCGKARKSEPMTAYCVLRTLTVLVCCCCVGSDRVAGVRGMQALDLIMRDDGRLCLR